MQWSFAPRQLGRITTVEIISLKGVLLNDRRGYMELAESIAGIPIGGEEAIRLASLFRSLPDGEPYRCHLPSYGLRFLDGSKRICEAAICWTSNNISGRVGTEEFWYNFDAQEEPSKALLCEIKRLVGPSYDGEEIESNQA